MKKLILLILLVTIILVAANLLLTAATPVPTDLKDPKALADKLVNQCAGVKEGELVWITGGADNVPLLEELWLQTRKQGAFPMLVLNSPNTGLRYYDEVPAKYDAQTNQFSVKMAELADVVIGIDMPYDPEGYAKLPVDRQAVVNRAGAPLQEVFDRRPIRQVSVGNGLYPSPGTAKEFGVTLDELTNDFWKGLRTDYAMLGQIGEKFKGILAAGKELEITGANGTNIKMGIMERPIYVSDGVVSAEEAKQGGATIYAWLPAGEVYLVPVPGTVEGTVVVDAVSYYGSEIQGLSLTFKAGKMTGMTAKNDFSMLKARYDAVGDAASNFGVIDFGINPDLQYKSGSKMCCYMQTGMVSFFTGDNTWAGGTFSQSGFGWAYFLPNMTVKVDGKTIIDNGKLSL